MCILLCFTCLGLLDFSPEEIRLEAYTANAKGSADGYVRINTLYCIMDCDSWVSFSVFCII